MSQVSPFRNTVRSASPSSRVPGQVPGTQGSPYHSVSRHTDGDRTWTAGAQTRPSTWSRDPGRSPRTRKDVRGTDPEPEVLRTGNDRESDSRRGRPDSPVPGPRRPSALGGIRKDRNPRHRRERLTTPTSTGNQGPARLTTIQGRGNRSVGPSQ